MHALSLVPDVPQKSRTIPLTAVPALRRAIPKDEQPAASQAFALSSVELARGEWRPEPMRRPVPAMVVEGVVVADVLLGGRASAHVYGPGDLIRPWSFLESGLPSTTRWSSTGGATVVLLDDAFAAATRRFPALGTVLQQLYADALDCLAVRTAIVSLPRVDQRVLGLFWQLADRWGTVRPEGILVDLELTHEFIGRLVGAKRPTVSLALQELSSSGTLTRTAEGWRLAHSSSKLLARDAESGLG